MPIPVPWRLALLCVALTGLPVSNVAGQRPDIPEFNTLRTPTSPAFVLLGAEPTSVERPSTPADFAVSVVNASQNFSALPKNFALEASPYWLAGHPTRRWQDDITRNIWQSLQRTFTVSAGTAQVGTELAPVTGVAISGRASLLSGRLSDKTIAALNRISLLAAQEQADLLVALNAAGLKWADLLLRMTQKDQPAFDDYNLIQAGLAVIADSSQGNRRKTLDIALDAVGRQVARVRAMPHRVDSLTLATAAAEGLRVAFQDGEIAAPEVSETARTALTKELQEFASVREGLFVELAGGASLQAPSAAIDSAALDRWGGLLTLSYQLPQVSFIAVARYLDAGNAPADDAFDVGARVLFNRAAYALSLEYVDRHLIHADSAPRPWRLAGVFDYKVNSTVWLTGSFGRDYQSQRAGSLLAQLGVSLQFAKDRVALPRPGVE
ncbi:MAG: hypothetical protein ACJ8BF_12925 [Gemmatimonadales bacterium]